MPRAKPLRLLRRLVTMSKYAEGRGGMEFCFAPRHEMRQWNCMKSILPWLCTLGLLCGAIFLFASNQNLARQVATLRDETNQAQTVRTELEQLKATGTPAQAAEI